MEENLNYIYNLCKLLNHEFIKEELENYLNGYDFKDAFKLIESYLWTFTDKNNHDILMSIGESLIKFTELKPNSTQEVTIQGKQYTSGSNLRKIFPNIENKQKTKNEDIILKIRKIEKRTKGIIVTDIYKTYSVPDNLENKYIVSEIREKQYVITKNKLEENLGNFYFDKINARDISSRITTYERQNSIQNLSDYTTNLLIDINNKKGITNLFKHANDIPIRIILNGTNISNIYTSIEGSDKISRIYDLYNGIISPENEKDIDNIRNGLLPNKCFDLKTIKSINFQIDNLTGERLDIPYKYLNYLSTLFNNKYNYNGNITLTRDELLKIILNKPKKTSKNPILIKKTKLI